MFKIENEHIYLTRGDKAIIELSIENYTFKKDDVIKFRVYKKKGLDKAPLIDKTVTVLEESEKIEIELSSVETKIDKIADKEVEYWYEVELNGETTVIGYDEEGAKILTLYPEGGDSNA